MIPLSHQFQLRFIQLRNGIVGKGWIPLRYSRSGLKIVDEAGIRPVKIGLPTRVLAQQVSGIHRFTHHFRWSCRPSDLLYFVPSKRCDLFRQYIQETQ